MASAITAKITGGNLIVTIPIASVKDAPMSTTGKNKVRASSGGFQDVGDGIRVNLTAISKP